jgi:hypothetical protein
MDIKEFKGVKLGFPYACKNIYIYIRIHVSFILDAGPSGIPDSQSHTFQTTKSMRELPLLASQLPLAGSYSRGR